MFFHQCLDVFFNYFNKVYLKTCFNYVLLSTPLHVKLFQLYYLLTNPLSHISTVKYLSTK